MVDYFLKLIPYKLRYTVMLTFHRINLLVKYIRYMRNLMISRFIMYMFFKDALILKLVLEQGCPNPSLEGWCPTGFPTKLSSTLLIG